MPLSVGDFSPKENYIEKTTVKMSLGFSSSVWQMNTCQPVILVTSREINAIDFVKHLCA